MDDKTKARLHLSLDRLSNPQLLFLERIVNLFSQPYINNFRNTSSDIISEVVLNDFGDILRIHHIFSNEPFTKDKFEHAIVAVLSNDGIDARLANRGNPGNDIYISEVPVSLKTQADRSLKREKIHISKFMELGKGKWTDNPQDLLGLRESFLRHMNNYERILSLRCLDRGGLIWEYELVEIPKSLLLQAVTGEFIMMNESKQYPKPGYCNVYDNESGELKFQLYFDGGTERKLQVKNIDKNSCVIHGSWKFKAYKEPEILD